MTRIRSDEQRENAWKTALNVAYGAKNHPHDLEKSLDHLED
jgi:hypothetical protein